MGRLAIIAGAGQLPNVVLDAHPNAYIVGFEGTNCSLSKRATLFSFNRLGALFDQLIKNKVDRVVMVGAMHRPSLDPLQFDDFMHHNRAQLQKAMQQGDDGLLRFILGLFIERGINPVGVHELVSGLTLPAGVLCGNAQNISDKDMKRADSILLQTAALDIGQGVVVENGLVLGMETLQGTNAMLNFVAQTDKKLRQGDGGIFVKREKINQDLRADMPTIGPETIHLVVEAGLKGIVLSPDKVIVLNQQKCIEIANDGGITILARARVE